ncbi:MAG: recombinase family protein [Defluviitaleaceae bacterium]|nr:recombinase family protein [Defluviitaleaceae bacterium]
MDIHNIRQQIKTKTIYDIPLRVTFYARVSSESDEQLNSLGNQISYYDELIRRNEKWVFVPGYIDEGISGISTKKRERFHQMIKDGKDGKFDLIITKEITRFARNTLDSISFTRELLSAGVGVFFQNDNINTLDEDSELRLIIMSGIAQDELRKLSSRIKFGHQQAIKKSVVLGNSRILGYVKQDKKLVIDETEAEMIRELFGYYATGEYSMKQIEKIFWDKGYRNLNGNKIAHSTMSNVISNPKYKGYYVGNKVKVVDMFTKKQKFLPPEEWVMFKDETGELVPAIVSEELWDKANEILNKRSEDVKNRQGICNHANLLTGKLFCMACGMPYYRRESKRTKGPNNSKWVCSGKINNGGDSCASFAIYEEEIKPLLFEVFKETEADAQALIEEYIRMYKSLDEDGDIPKRVKEQERRIDLAIKKKTKLLEYNVTGQISDKDFISMKKQCNDEIEAAERELMELEEQRNSKDEYKKHIDTIRRVLQEAERDAAKNIIGKEFVDKYIDKIFITPEGGTALRFEIKVFTGDTTEKYLKRLRERGRPLKQVTDQLTCQTNDKPVDRLHDQPPGLPNQPPDETSLRSGHTFKKMIEAQERQMAGK